MRTRKMRFLSALLAMAMMFMLTPTAAFADNSDVPRITTNENSKVANLEFDASGLPIIPEGTSGTYIFKDSQNNNAEVCGIPEARTYIGLRAGYSLRGADTTAIKASVNAVGNVHGGLYASNVTASKDSKNNVGTITEGIFLSSANASNGIIKGGLFLNVVNKSGEGKIEGGVFAKKPTADSVKTITAQTCKIYTDYSYEMSKELSDNTTVYIKNTAYVVGQKAVVVTVDSPAFDHWDVKINGEEKTYADLSNDAKSEVDSNDSDIHVLTFTTSGNDDVEITPVAKKVEFKLAEINGEMVPVYNGKIYMGNSITDGWELTKNTSGNYPYSLTIWQGAEVDLENNTLNWAFRNYGTLKNGIVPGNLVNCENTDGKYGPVIGQYGHVENVAFKMNVRLDQDSPISWVTLRNATACEGVFTDIVGVIGQQTLTVKPSVSEEHFKGWTYSGDVSDALAKQIDAQKDNYTMTLTLDGEAEDTLALTATTDGRLYAIDLWEGDGTASVDGTEVAAAAPGDRVTLTMDESKIPDGMTFDHWSISPEVEFAEGCKATDRTTTFIMPEQDVSVHANLRTDSDDGMDMATVVAGVAVGAGVAYLGYQVGTELYAKQILGDGVAIPRTRADVALTAWQLAGKPEVAMEGEPLSEAAMAQKWAVESGLIQNVDGSFNPDKKMSKIKALKVLDTAKKMG